MEDTAGALLVDKPQGLTSHDVVARVRGLAREKRCGHTGTLDPFATGLLVLCLGRATRLSRFVTGLSKTYLATVRFGYATDTYDRTGRPAGETTGGGPSRDALLEALETFRGPQEQQPPPFSAKKIDGKRAYRLARAGVVVRPAPVQIVIDELELLDLTGSQARLRVSASSGTYIRSLAHDLGRKLGPGAHLEALRRTRVGSFAVEDASTLESLESLSREGRLRERLLSPARMLEDMRGETLTAEEAARFVHGRTIDRPDPPPGFCKLLDPSGGLLGVARRNEGADAGLKPVLVWARPGGGKAQGR